MQNETLTGMCRHRSPTDVDEVIMAWKKPEARKLGCGTAETIAGKGGRGMSARTEEGGGQVRSFEVVLL